MDRSRLILLTSVCVLEARLCEVEARLDDAESAEIRV